MGVVLLSPRSRSQAGKWLGFVTAVWVQSVSGNDYGFSNYSGTLKSVMGLTQLQLNNLSVAKDVGKAFGILAGVASDSISTAPILLIGCVESLVGFGMQWLVISQSITPLPYWQMCVFVCIGGNSTTWMSTAAVVTCMRNFRMNRGPVSGILKGYLGLSAAIFTDLCTALFSNSPSSFLLMLAVVPAIVCIAAMIFLHEIPAADSMEGEVDMEVDARCFSICNVVAVVTAGYLLAFNLCGNLDNSSSSSSSSSASSAVSQGFSVVLVLLMGAPLVVPLYVLIKPKSRSRQRCGDFNSDVKSWVNAPLLGGGKEERKEEEEEEGEGGMERGEMGDGGAKNRKRPSIGEDHTITEAMGTVEFWILFGSCLCGTGTGLVVMNNLGQMVPAMGYTDVSIFVSTLSIWGFFGRIGSGSASEYLLKKAAIPRPLWNATAQFMMAVGYIVLAIGLSGSLYVGSIVVGLSYGIRLTVTVITISELFGLKHYGLIHIIITSNLSLGSFLLSGVITGILYDAEATRTAEGGDTCVGAHCYRLVFVIMVVVCVLGLGLDVLLAFRTKNVYWLLSGRPLKHSVVVRNP